MDRYCVFGNPIAHSKSPDIHAAFAAQTGQQLTYEKRLAPLDGFAAAVHAFIAEGGKGANVTVPFKLDAHRLANALTIRAQAAGAVNTLLFDAHGITGDNTDGAGLVADITGNAGVAIAGRRVLLLGAGGAARGAVLPLLEQRPAALVIANRTVATAEALVQQFAALGGEGVLSAGGFGDLAGSFDIVVNATSASLQADLPPIPALVFHPGTLALDMMYGKEPTVFLRFAAQHGAVPRDGLGMLVEQAAEAFALWRGVRPDTAAVLASIRRTL
ncbi:shikimate dehydrogenase [Massilia sp. YMA4]|uniref:shikimate dehydrogenase n=1 Tax=Massilia sp. YMA4 TaxID=1593482 RepID=UPI000DD0F41E|nr:shikimate dehydrogenase [Massilia sp. YMA4]AXA92571.1 shikimate dehydrogenase [Massilia sp. YMA4]